MVIQIDKNPYHSFELWNMNAWMVDFYLCPVCDNFQPCFSSLSCSIRYFGGVENKQLAVLRSDTFLEAYISL